MSEVQNINPEKEPLPASWVPRVITGGKGGDPPDDPPDNYLEMLPVGAVFLASARGSIQGFLFEVIFKGDVFTLLRQQVGDIVQDIYVNNRLWCIENKDYEVLGLNPPDRGGNNEHEPYDGSAV